MTNDAHPVQTAAEWLAAQPEPPAHIVPTLKDRFGLSAKEACLAIAQARGLTRADAGTSAREGAI
ncbi:hypothetical protein C8J35_103531 [Rhizobium sp. PP-F2F-G38]|nr:hypothetical protein C8J35_103531 [Rhizobium sp. PP-F2F-G38]